MSYRKIALFKLPTVSLENFSISFNTVILNANLEEDETLEMISLPA